MDFKLLIRSVVDACKNSPILVGLAVIGFCVTIFLIVDAHRSKKGRARHKWK